MICPSSSDEEADAADEEVSTLAVNFQKNPTRSPSKTDSHSVTSNQGSTHSSVRAGSPSPSLHNEDAEAKARNQEEDDRKMKLQLYVFVLRCIAYPFNAKQTSETTKRQTKVNKQQLQTVKDRFQAFLSGDTQIKADEAFINAITSYYEIFLKSDRVARMVQSGGCSANDFREVFKNNIEKRVQGMREINGLSKETVTAAWMAKFDAIYRGDDDHNRRHANRHTAAATTEMFLAKEQMYEMFQNILGIRKFEHQLLYNACQLDNADEQAAAIRRELDGRLRAADIIVKNDMYPSFFRRKAESEEYQRQQYITELRTQVSLLMANLEALPVSRSLNDKSAASLLSLRRMQGSSNKSQLLEQSTEEEFVLSKSDVTLQFTLELVVSEVQGLKSLAPNKVVYCTMEADGGEKLQTDHAEVAKPVWDTQGDFTTRCPLPQVKVKLFTESTGVLSIDDKELGKVTLYPTPNSTLSPTQHRLKHTKHCPDPEVYLKLSYRMERPLNVKYCGFLWAEGGNVWKKWKKRFFVLVQVSQYNFAMCSYSERKPEPNELLQLDGYTIDYSPAILNQEGGRSFFNAVKEGDNVMFASDAEQDRIMWVQALYRATGQSHKPVPPTEVQTVSVGKHGQLDAPISQYYADRARKCGMDDFIAADPCKYDHSTLFALLQRLTLHHRLNDCYTCLGWFSPGQNFVLDEYCARYGVRTCHRQLCYMNELLDRAEEGLMVDPTLLHFCYSFCCPLMYGQCRVDGLVATVTKYEKAMFDKTVDRLRAHLEYQITHFRYCFPFGRPQGFLKATLSLLERVISPVFEKDEGTEKTMRPLIEKCLEKAALINYTRVSEYASVDASSEGDEENDNKSLDDDSTKRLGVVTRVAELCIDVLQQNEEHHYEAFAWFSDVMKDHAELFWSLYAVDMDAMLAKQELYDWNSFTLFQILNEYLISDSNLHNGKFHSHLQSAFAPMVVRYVDVMQSAVAQCVDKGFGKTAGDMPCTNPLKVVHSVLWQLTVLQEFLVNLRWPDEVFALHITHRMKMMSSDMIQSVVTRTLQRFTSILNACRLSLDFVVTPQLCAFMDVMLECRKGVEKLCGAGTDPSGASHLYHSEVDTVLEDSIEQIEKLLVGKFDKTLVTLVLVKLARYDEGSLTASFLSLTKHGLELSTNYTQFVRNNLDVLRDKISDEVFVEQIFTSWYNSSMQQIADWLMERAELQLHVHQLKILIKIFKKMHRDFGVQGVAVIQTESYDSVHERLTVEEATASVTIGPLGNNITMKDSEDEIDDV